LRVLNEAQEADLRCPVQPIHATEIMLNLFRVAVQHAK